MHCSLVKCFKVENSNWMGLRVQYFVVSGELKEWGGCCFRAEITDNFAYVIICPIAILAAFWFLLKAFINKDVLLLSGFCRLCTKYWLGSTHHLLIKPLTSGYYLQK